MKNGPEKNVAPRRAGGVMGTKAVRTRYNETLFRSRLESLWARWLDWNLIAWSYEPIRVALGNRSYLPDFYLRGFGYAEVKPVMPSEEEFFLASMLAETSGSSVYFLVGKPGAHACLVSSLMKCGRYCFVPGQLG